MNQLPSDPAMLLSVINTRLRDNYDSLDELCDDLNVNRADIENALAAIDYTYNPELNQFR